MNELFAMLDRLTESEDLTDWESGFVRNMQEKRQRYGTDVRFSPGQEAKIRQIYKDRT